MAPFKAILAFGCGVREHDTVRSGLASRTACERAAPRIGERSVRAARRGARRRSRTIRFDPTNRHGPAGGGGGAPSTALRSCSYRRRCDTATAEHTTVRRQPRACVDRSRRSGTTPTSAEQERSRFAGSGVGRAVPLTEIEQHRTLPPAHTSERARTSAQRRRRRRRRRRHPAASDSCADPRLPQRAPTCENARTTYCLSVGGPTSDLPEEVEGAGAGGGVAGGAADGAAGSSELELNAGCGGGRGALPRRMRAHTSAWMAAA